MNRFIRSAICLAALAAPASAVAECPAEAEAQTAVVRYVTVEYWSPGQRDIWKVADVRNFAFGAFAFGKTVRKDMDYTGPRDVCPARFTFSFDVLHNDAKIERTEMGAGKIFYFFRDDFGDWTFKIG